MKSHFDYLLLILISSLVTISQADTNINLSFNGNIKAASCNITGGENINIDLKKLPNDLFNAPKSGSEWKNFDINLKECSSVINQIKITFSGAADTNNIDSLYKNQGSARNIAVQLETADGGTPLGNKKTVVAAVSNQTAKVSLRTRAFSATGNVSPGSISANITATIVYL